MAPHRPIAGHPTWVHDRGGSRAPVLLLHGGLSNSDLLLEAIGPSLNDTYRVVAFDRRGHGYTGDTEAPFHYADMATEAIEVLHEVVGGPAHLVGWSDGGIVALLVALERPDLVRRLVVVGVNYHYDAFANVEPDPTFSQLVRTEYLERSPDGPEHFRVVVRKSLAMWGSEPALTTDDVARITQPTLVVAGDDEEVALAHTCSLYEALPRGRLAVVPGASHALPTERPDVLADLVVEFLAATEPPRTLIPVRRAIGGRVNRAT